MQETNQELSPNVRDAIYRDGGRIRKTVYRLGGISVVKSLNLYGAIKKAQSDARARLKGEKRLAEIVSTPVRTVDWRTWVVTGAHGEHVVKIGKDARIYCDCIDWAMRCSGTKNTCKHVEAVLYHLRGRPA
jgi:hypothetical protein